MKKVILSFLPFLLFSQSFNRDRTIKTFEDSFKNRELRCVYFQPEKNIMITPVDETSFIKNSLSRNFKIETVSDSIDLSVEIFNNPDPMYKVVVDNNIVYEGILDQVLFTRLLEFNYGGFFLSYLNQVSGNIQTLKNINLSKIKCNLDVAKTPPLVLEGSHHISVHPHSNYDYLSLLGDPIASYLESMRSYVLIESRERLAKDIDYKKFLETGVYSTNYPIYRTAVDIPDNALTAISPVGYNDFIFEGDEVEIFYTGGNHNYCIFNNTRNVLWALLYSKKEIKLKINYDSSAVVVQRRGILDNKSLHFKKKHVKGSNILKDVFLKNPNLFNKYHNGYSNYFEYGFLSYFKGLYKKLIYTYNADGFTREKVLDGNGERTLEITLNYL